MNIAYFDCFAGAAGDMIVASLIDAGAKIEDLRKFLTKLPLDGYKIEATTNCHGGMDAIKFDVIVEDGEKPHRHLHHIIDIIEKAELPKRVEERAKTIFTHLARAEAQVHGTTVEKVHFHEVGAVDSIVDIVGACLAMEFLGIDEIRCSAIPVGNGMIKCDHGLIPAPAPATARLISTVKCPTFASPNKGEATTPTAAAILTTLCTKFGAMPDLCISSVGYGCGTRTGDAVPNVLRVFIGSDSQADDADSVVEISANIDDCSGELIGYAMEKLIQAGCLDVWATPTYTKKSRPCWILSCLARHAQVDEAQKIIFSQTTTLGLRKKTVDRVKLKIKFKNVETPFGVIRMKSGLLDDRPVTASVEFEDARKASEAHGVSVKEVIESTQTIFNQLQN